MSKKISLGVALTIALIAMAVTFSLTMVASMNMFNTTVSSVKSKERQYNKLAEIDRFVRASEYFTIHEDTLNDTIASGYMLGINDKYARYYTASAYASRQGQENGTLMGIGVAVVNDASSGYGRIIRVYENSPASEAGLEVGGFITAVGDVSVRTMTESTAIMNALLGTDGAVTTINYLTPDRQERTFDLIHRNYQIPTVFSQMTAGSCGYLRITNFTTGTAVEFRSAVDGLLGQGASCLVVDLRDTASDNLSAALTAADYCVPAGVMAQSQPSSGAAVTLRTSDENEVTVPMVCLINGSTSGAAELFASCLHNMAGASLVGTTSAGKGVVMSDAHSFSDGSAAYISVALLLDSNGENWNGTGLTPDLDASLTTDQQTAYYDFTVETDPQINAAVNEAMNRAGVH